MWFYLKCRIYPSVGCRFCYRMSFHSIFIIQSWILVSILVFFLVTIRIKRIFHISCLLESFIFYYYTLQVGLKQGLEMLSIFKSYTAKSSLLDDFKFYENREKSLRSKSNKPTTPQMEMYSNGDIPVSFNSFFSINFKISIPMEWNYVFYYTKCLF